MSEPRMTGSKVCSRCRVKKPVLAFSVRPKAADGLRSECRECASKVSARCPSRAGKRIETARKAFLDCHPKIWRCKECGRGQAGGHNTPRRVCHYCHTEQ